MTRVRLWQSEAWLKRKWQHERLTEQQIADLAGTSQRTINEWLRKFGLKK